jgi:hypothetical protein
MMERNLDFWPRFGLMAQLAQNGPKLENWTPTTALDIGSSSLWGSWTYRSPENEGVKFRFWVPFWTYGPKWPKIRKWNSSYNFWAKIFTS